MSADSALTFRLATLGDATLLALYAQAMALETEDKALDPETIHLGTEAVLKDPWKGFYLIAEDAGLYAGSLLVTFEWSDWRNGTIWWIQSVYVSPSWRGRGAYQALHCEVERRVQAAGAVGLRLYVVADNDRARRAYEKVGMTGGHYVVYEQYF